VTVCLSSRFLYFSSLFSLVKHAFIKGRKIQFTNRALIPLYRLSSKEDPRRDNTDVTTIAFIDSALSRGHVSSTRISARIRRPVFRGRNDNHDDYRLLIVTARWRESCCLVALSVFLQTDLAGKFLR
jgi:hypothetical protein